MRRVPAKKAVPIDGLDGASVVRLVISFVEALAPPLDRLGDQDDKQGGPAPNLKGAVRKTRDDKERSTLTIIKSEGAVTLPKGRRDPPH